MFGKRLKSARKMAGLSLERLAERAGGLTKQAIHNYEIGKRKPDSQTLIKLAKALNVRPEYFLRKPNLEIATFEYRKKSRLSAKAKDYIEEKTRDVIERYIEIESILGIQSIWENPLENIIIKNSEDAEKAAEELRKKWNLGANAIPKLIESLEHFGIKVINVTANENFDGLSCFINNMPIIIYNDNFKENVRIRFTIAHELGHILLNLEEILNDKEKEIICHRFAGAFLLPKEKIYLELGGNNRSKITFEELLWLKEEYGISMQAIAKRLHYLGIISDSAYKRFNILVNKYKWRQNEPGAYKINEKPERFKSLVMRAFAEEIISVGKAATLLNTTVDDLENSAKFII